MFESGYDGEVELDNHFCPSNCSDAQSKINLRVFQALPHSHDYDLIVRTRPDLEFFQPPPSVSDIWQEMMTANPKNPSNVVIIPDTYWLDYVGGLSDRYWIAGRVAAWVLLNVLVFWR